MHFLIVKTGALGDVVRTSYFAKALKQATGQELRLSWITARASADLLNLNPHIDDLWFDFSAAKSFRFDRVFSLDDELEMITQVAGLATGSITGATLLDGRPSYTPDAAAWFDMGLHSRFGKQRADELKKLNQRSHAQIFSELFGVPRVDPHFYLKDSCRDWAAGLLPRDRCLIGINPYSGGRWPSKELRPQELRDLIDQLLVKPAPFGADTTVVLIGAGQDYVKNQTLVAELGRSDLTAVCTDESVQHLAAVIGSLDYLITSDSLALHLATAQHIPFTVFFSPTSAAEIDDWGIGTKVISTAADYCSYRKDADNSSITADRVLDAVRQNRALSR